MRYKQLVTDKLGQLENGLSSLGYYFSINDANGGKQGIEHLKERIEEIQALINTNEEE